MTLLISDALCLEHHNFPGHPEQPARLQAIDRHLKASGLWELLEHLPARDASVDELARCHSRYYIRTIEQASKHAARTRTGLVRVARCSACAPGTYRAAVRAAGAAMAACEAVARHDMRKAREARNANATETENANANEHENAFTNAFVAVRPPGHRAGPAAAADGCIFNNVAVAARHCQEVLGFKRIAILDWDVHHGSGTQEIFYAEPNVFFLSAHQRLEDADDAITDSADQTGQGAGQGTTLNLPFSPGTSSGQVIADICRALDESVRAFDPDFILISAGFDACKGDPTGTLKLEPDDFAALSTAARKLAAECCEGRLVSVLEGGHDPAKLGACVEAYVAALRETAGPPDWA